VPDTALPPSHELTDHRWQAGRLDPGQWRSWPGWLDLAWVLLWMAGLACILIFARWEALPFHLIWVTFALLYSFRIRKTKPTLWVLAAMIVTTFAAIGFDVLHGMQPADELTEVPLMAAMFWVMMWHGHRRLAANAALARIGAENAELLAAQRRFLQDASHQLRTPITIALGHSELLALSLVNSQDKRDIDVIVGELNRLKVLSERLLLIAASENPDFLKPEPVALDQLTAEIFGRWRPTVPRRWQLGQLDQVTVTADRERIALAVDALLENAVQHTGQDDLVRMSVQRAPGSAFARLSVEDSGSGISPPDLARIFERFATGSSTGGRRGTGLGLALVRAVARGHGGEVRAYSTLGRGSRFELVLPAPSAQPGWLSATMASSAGGFGPSGSPVSPGSAVSPSADERVPAGWASDARGQASGL
jgi:signal transduction histidine kinase